MREAFDITNLFVVLVRKADTIVTITEAMGGEQQRYYKFNDFEVIDIDQDEIHEIVTTENGWYGGGGTFITHLYSPKYNEWFGVSDSESVSYTDFSSCDRTVTYSDNLAEEKFSKFKEFLEIENPNQCSRFGPG